MFDAATISAGAITADKVSAASISSRGLSITDAEGNVRVRMGSFDKDIVPVPRTDSEKEQWPGGLHLRDPNQPVRSDKPITTAEEVW